jgi:hypothetical protein
VGKGFKPSFWGLMKIKLFKGLGMHGKASLGADDARRAMERWK